MAMHVQLFVAFCLLVEKHGPAKVAKRLGISESMVSRLKNGHRAPSLGTAGRIARATKTPLGEWKVKRVRG